MPRDAIFAWEGQEYAFEERGADWYWALGIITVAVVLTCILLSNILLALVAVAAAGAVGVQAAKHRKTHRFAIYETGIAIDNELYRYEDMRDFAVLEYLDPQYPPALSIKTNHIFSPHLLIPINDYDPDDVYEYVLNHLPEGNHEETPLDRLITFLRF